MPDTLLILTIQWQKRQNICLHGVSLYYCGGNEVHDTISKISNCVKCYREKWTWIKGSRMMRLARRRTLF